MQTSYSQYNDELQLGRIADTSIRQIDSGLCEGAIGIAKAVVRGTDKNRQYNQAGTGAGAGALIVGITVLSQSVEQAQVTGLVQYADKEMAPIMKKGRIVVQVAQAVVAGNTANFVLATGQWTDAAVGAGIEATTMLKCRFVTSAAAAGALAILEVHNAN